MLILERLFDLVFPNQCLFCRRFTDSLLICSSCQGRVEEEFFVPPFCQTCGKPTYYEVARCTFCCQQKITFKVRSLAPYDGMVRELIVHYKLGRKKKLANYLIEASLKNYIEYFKEVDLITFIPATRRCLKERGFNQAELLAKRIAKEVNLPLVDTLFYKREPVEQKSLGFKERKENLRDIFSIKAEVNSQITAQSLLLVDDVLTTGSTLKEACCILKKEGKVKNVRAFTVARQL